MAGFRKPSMALAVVLLAAATASAQVTCTQNAQPNSIRAGGITEYIGEVDLNCTNNGAGATAQFVLSLNTTVTNAVTGKSADGYPVVQAGAVVQTTGGVIAQVVPGIVYATGGNVNNALRFPSVSLPAGTTFIVRFVNVRADASQPFAPLVTFNGQTEIVAFVSASLASGASVTFSNQTVTGLPVAVAGTAMNFSVTNCDGSALANGGNISLTQCAGSIPGAAANYGVNFAELQTTAFKTPTEEDGVSVTGGGATVCDGITALCGSGKATVSNGVQLIAQWTILPTLVGKIHVWVSPNQTAASSAGLTATFSTTPTNQVTPVSVTCNGGSQSWVQLDDAATETAAWAIATSDLGSLDNITFGWTVSYEAGALPAGSASIMSLAGTLGPQSTVIAPVPLGSDNTSADAPVVRFDTAYQPGTANMTVTLLSPGNGATGVSLAPALSWDAWSGATSYDVYFGTSSPPPLLTSAAGTNYNPGTLAALTTYYWYVVANTSAGWVSSATWSFTTSQAPPPAAPVLTSPINGATGALVAPTLVWNASIWAASYNVYFGTSSPPPLVTSTVGTSYAPGTLSQNTTYYWQIVAQNGAGSGSSDEWSFTTGTPPTGLEFIPVTPCRVVDTRGPAGPFGGPTMTAASTRSFAIPQSACGIPATAEAYSLNATVVPEGPLSFLSLWPAGQAQPLVSTLNSYGGAVVANAAIVPAGSGGAVNVYVTNPTDVILDINGYFETSSGATSYSFYSATPCRVADTRNPTGQFGGPSMFADQTRDFPIPLSPCGIPATARAYSLNVTAVPDGFLGYLTTWPTGQAQPNVSTLNSWTGKVVANAALVPAGTNESISVFVTNPTDVILDINGYFSQPGSPGALLFYPITPCRIADTRNANGPFGGPKMGAATTRSFAIPTSGCDVPSTAAAYSLNVTVAPDGPLYYLTAWPTGSAQASVSTLNSWDGSVVANAAIVPAGTNGAISIFVTNPTQVILDIDGYFAP